MTMRVSREEFLGVPSNEERRVVSKMLRCLTKHAYPIDLEEFGGVVVDLIGLQCFKCKDAEAYARLADLIEPLPERTCRIVENDEGYSSCSVCGAHYLCMSCASYCPDCGAKVVENAD